MGFQLWYSKNTGIRRNGTTFEEIQDIFVDNITTKYIFEELACCRLDDNPYEVKQTLKRRDFDLLGVIDDNKSKIGFIEKETINDQRIEDNLRSFDINNIIAVSTPLSQLFSILDSKESVFVLQKDEITGIVTRADLNKPIVRIYLFGIISLFEMNLNYWIKQYYQNEEWQAYLSEKRIKIAHEIFKERQGNNLELELLECLQFCDKREILRKSNKFLERFDYPSKSKFKVHLENVEKLRNELAHSQNSIIANLEWKDFIETINRTQQFLEKSEIEIEK